MITWRAVLTRLDQPSYVRAVARLEHPNAPNGKIGQWVRRRMIRQRVMTGPEAPYLWAVVDEVALRHPLGGGAVMRQQLRRLIEATALPNLTLQVVSLRRSGLAAAGGVSSILRFADGDLPDTVHPNSSPAPCIWTRLRTPVVIGRS